MHVDEWPWLVVFVLLTLSLAWAISAEQEVIDKRCECPQN